MEVKIEDKVQNSKEKNLLELVKNRQFDHLKTLVEQLYPPEKLWKLCGYTSYYNSRVEEDFLIDHNLLVWSILFGYANVVSYFFDKEYSAETPKVMERAIDLAIKKKQADIVELLLDNTESKDLNSSSFFISAIRSNDINTTTVLLQDDRLDPTLDKHYAFRLACNLGYVEQVQLLLPYSRRGLQGGLTEALSNKKTGVVKLLLNEDCIDPNKVLIDASKAGYIEIVKHLLETNTKLTPLTQRSLPLRLAVENNHLDLVLLFLKDGRAQPQALGNEAIRKASEKGFTEIVSCLLADPRVNPSAWNNEAIRNAVKNFHLDTIKVLMAHEAVNLEVLVECAVNYRAPNNVRPQTVRYDIFKLIIENKRVNFEKALEQVYKGPKRYHEPSISKLILLKVNFSLEKLIQNTRNKNCISNTLVNTLGIFSKKSELGQTLPQDVIRHIGEMMLNTSLCSNGASQ